MLFSVYTTNPIDYVQMGDDTNPNSVIEEIMESPEKLRDLDLDAFAEELERQVCVCLCVRVRVHARIQTRVHV